MKWTDSGVVSCLFAGSFCTTRFGHACLLVSSLDLESANPSRWSLAERYASPIIELVLRNDGAIVVGFFIWCSFQEVPDLAGL